jgi:hypothetical protein
MTMEAERIDQPTRALFSIYFAEDTDAATASIYQFRARLAHICDGFLYPPTSRRLPHLPSMPLPS